MLFCRVSQVVSYPGFAVVLYVLELFTHNVITFSFLCAFYLVLLNMTP